jgi:class 3 adenylate cyclase/tetratricopeptide (TPR) repeat protein
MSSEQQQLEVVIAALEAQRALLGDAVVDMAVAPLRARLAGEMAFLPAACEPVQTLRQVTILFLDVVGSTTLSRLLDPEEISAVLDEALQRGTAIVAAQGGKVLQYVGDNILAAFGADEAREDDAERAVRCGLELLELGKALGVEVLDAHRHAGFNVRIGIHTGSVLLGGGVNAEGTIRGIAVNIAARMEQTAPAGTLRISHDTYAQVRGVFDVERQPPLIVKGMGEPVVTYLVRGVKPRAFRVTTRGIEGVETRMIGRDAEFACLQDAFTALYLHPRLAVVTVVADAGVGKSRLLYEFDNWIETRPERFVVYQGRAQPQTERQPYGLLRDILAWRLQIADNDALNIARDKLEREIVSLFASDDGDAIGRAHAHVLGHLIGLDFGASPHIAGIAQDGSQLRDRAFHVAAQMFRRVVACAGMPIVLLLEDLHWADEGSLDFLDYLLRVGRDVPMLVVATTRPALLERRVDWGRDPAMHLRLDLDILDDDASSRLSDELLKRLPRVPEALREIVVGGAAGNPFYMEELVKMLVDDGVIRTGANVWELNVAAIGITRVPPTLTGVLQARIDGLHPVERLALQQASIIGIVFWDDGLAAIDSRAVDALPALVRREFIAARPQVDVDGVREYVFKHQILHHVTGETVLRRMRRDWHGKVAAWMAGLDGTRAVDLLGATAEHFAEAGDETNACEYFVRAAEGAVARFAHSAASGYVDSAFALLDDDAATDAAARRWRLLDVRETILDLQGRRAEQRIDLDAMQKVADAMGDDGRRAVAALRRSRYAMVTGDNAAMESNARDAMRIGEAIGNDELALLGQRQLAMARLRSGDIDAASEIARQALVSARAIGLRKLEARLLNVLAQCGGDPLSSLRMDQQQLAIEQEIGDRRAEANALFNIGWGWLALGEHVEAERHLRLAQHRIRAVGNRHGESYPLLGLALLALRCGDAEQAQTHAEAALAIACEVRDPLQEAIVQLVLGHALLAQGREADAQSVFLRARDVAIEIGNNVRFDADAGLALVALAGDDVPAAMRALSGVLDHFDGGGSLDGTEQPRVIWLVAYRVLARAGDPRTSGVLRGAYEGLQRDAAAIPDNALRAGYLENIPENRDIVAAWATS